MYARKTTLDNDDIDISMSHVLLFPKIYNLSVCHTIKANRQKSIPCYLTLCLYVISKSDLLYLYIYL